MQVDSLVDTGRSIVGATNKSVQCPARGYVGRSAIPGWAAPPFDHVLGDARLRDLKPELEQFAVNAWRAPRRIFDTHPPDQSAQLRVDLWPASPST